MRIFARMSHWSRCWQWSRQSSSWFKFAYVWGVIHKPWTYSRVPAHWVSSWWEGIRPFKIYQVRIKFVEFTNHNLRWIPPHSWSGFQPNRLFHLFHSCKLFMCRYSSRHRWPRNSSRWATYHQGFSWRCWRSKSWVRDNDELYCEFNRCRPIHTYSSQLIALILYSFWGFPSIRWPFLGRQSWVCKHWNIP